MELIGYKTIDLPFLTSKESLKRDLLYFDRLVIDEDTFHFWLRLGEIATKTHDVARTNFRFHIDEIYYLIDNNYIEVENFGNGFTRKDSIKNGSFFSFNDAFLEAQTTNLHSDDYLEKGEKFLNLIYELNILNNSLTRHHCSILYQNGIINYQPIIDSRTDSISPHYFKSLELSSKIGNTKKTDVLNLILKKMPIPASNVSWQEIFDYKANSEITLYRSALTNWLSEVSYTNLHPLEIEQKFDYLHQLYCDKLKKEKIKYSTGTFELIVTATLEVVEQVAKLNLSSAAKTIFDLRKKNIDLLIDETSIPGREIAYISKLKDKFEK